MKAYMDRLVEQYHVPGVDCVVCQNHEVIFRYYTGLRDPEKQKPMTGDELYIIFSMTKMLTCTCALQLLEKGKYVMSDPVAKYLPEFERMRVSYENGSLEEPSYAYNPITVKDLFTMGAGLIEET